MAIKRLTIDGNGQLELNNAAFRRDGRVEAQCALSSTDFASMPAENGMILAVDRVNKLVKLPAANAGIPAIVYSAEHIYDEAAYGLKNFNSNVGKFLPRLGFLSVGDKFTSNTISYDTTGLTNDDAVIAALKAHKTTAVYGTVCATTGAIRVTTSKPASGVVLRVVEYHTLPDGQPAPMFMVESL